MAEPLQPKIPETVDLKDADPERRELYGKAAQVFTEERRKSMELASGGPAGSGGMNSSGMFVPGGETAPEQPKTEEPEKPVEPEIADEDKRAFVRAILSDRVFEKLYPLFGGQVEVTFVDRSTEETDKIFDRLGKVNLLDEDAWSAEADILCLCSTLREIKTPEGRKSFPPTDDYTARRAELRKLPRPLYEALIDTSRNFEELINHLIIKARKPDFWPAGGNALQSRRTTGTR
jgi:hypothetical protein